MLIIAITAYAIAMTLANLSIAHFGPASIPFNAFALIGLDLALRDWLHVRLARWQMLALIAASGLLTWVLNPAAGHIAAASAAAFMAAALADWLAFTALPGSWLARSAGSNVAGAAVDSLVFPLLAFGVIAWPVVLPMFGAKVAGGLLWALLLSRTSRAVA
jgi:uncharacterized PurR-regulated membrane protein YhhQ (DUF165 family)